MDDSNGFWSGSLGKGIKYYHNLSNQVGYFSIWHGSIQTYWEPWDSIQLTEVLDISLWKFDCGMFKDMVFQSD